MALWSELRERLTRLQPMVEELEALFQDSRLGSLMICPAGLPRGLAKDFAENLYALACARRELETLATTASTAMLGRMRLPRVKENDTAAVAAFLVAVECSDDVRATGKVAALVAIATMGEKAADLDAWDRLRKRWDEALRAARLSPKRMPEVIAFARTLAEVWAAAPDSQENGTRAAR